jgi:Subtilisin inhibitor-like
MRIAAATLAALAASGCMSRADSDKAATGPTADLQIEISIRGSEAPTKVWTLHCPPGGNLPDAATACNKLAEVKDPFAPVPKGTACTQIYGGPEIATVSGTFNGERVDAKFSRGDGCELERWNRVGFLFPSE